MEVYFLTEETRVGTVPKLANPYIPTLISCYGKKSFEQIEKILQEIDCSPLSELRVRLFSSNKEYNSYIRRMQSLGTKINYNK